MRFQKVLYMRLGIDNISDLKFIKVYDLNVYIYNMIFNLVIFVKNL